MKPYLPPTCFTQFQSSNYRTIFTSQLFLESDDGATSPLSFAKFRNFTSQLSLLKVKTPLQFQTHFANCFVKCEVQIVNSNSDLLKFFKQL